MHDRDRADPADRLVQGGPAGVRVHPAGLQPQQRGDRLQVVLHPVVDLPDGGVLGHQFAVAAAQFGDVPAEHQRARQGALGLERDGPQGHHPALDLHLGLPGCPAARQLDQRLVHGRPGGRHQFGGRPAQVAADQVGGEAEPVVGGERVGAGVGDHAVRVEPDQAVADPGRGVHVGLLHPGVGEGAGGDHLGQVGGALQIGELQPAGGADGQQVGVAGDHPEHLALAPHRDRLDPDRHLLAPLRIALAHDPTLVVGGVQQGAAAARDEVADHVVLVGGRAGVGPHLGDRDVPDAVPGGDPQDQVGEGQVGEQLPLRDQHVQPLHIGTGQGGVAADEFVQRGHRLSVAPGARGRPGPTPDRRAPGPLPQVVQTNFRVGLDKPDWSSPQ